MKRRDLIKLLEENGWRLLCEGSNHTLYYKDGYPRNVPVSRQREIKENVVRKALKEAGIKQPPL